MFKTFLISIFLIFSLAASENNKTNSDVNTTKESNNTELNKNLKAQIEREKKYKKEQKFYLGDEYNLTEHEVDEKSLKDVPVIEPEYDFDITDLYNDQ